MRVTALMRLARFSTPLRHLQTEADSTTTAPNKGWILSTPQNVANSRKQSRLFATVCDIQKSLKNPGLYYAWLVEASSPAGAENNCTRHAPVCARQHTRQPP